MVEEFPDYEVSDYGRVRRITTYGRGKAGTVRKLGLSPAGYPQVCLTHRDGRRQTFTVHRLVATAFIPRQEGACEVNHIDGTRDNNHYSNLEWVTSSGNRFHAYRVGKLSAIGEHNGQAKLTENDVMAIRAGDEAPRLLADRYGVSRATIYDIRMRRSWVHLPPEVRL